MEHGKQNGSTELALLVLLSLLWGGSFTLIKVAVETVPPATMVTARLAIGAAILLLLARLLGMALVGTPRLWAALLIQGIVQSALPFTLISWGEKHIDSGLAGLLNATPPLFVFLISLFGAGGRRGGGRKALGLATGLAGVAAVVGPEVAARSGEAILGQIAIIGASVSYAVAALHARRFSSLPPLVTAACSMTLAALLMLPISLCLDRPWTLSPSAEAVWAVLGLGLLSTALAMLVYFRLVRTLGPLGVTTGSYLRAGFSVALGVVLLGEEPGAGLAAGFVLILAGVAIVNGWSGTLPVTGQGRS